MIGFVIAAAVLLAMALAIVLPAMLRTEAPEEVERKKINVAIGRERLAELEAARAAGTLSEEDFEQERRDLEESVLEDIQTTEQSDSNRTGRWAALSVLLLVPVLSISLYVYLGMPAVFQIQTMQSQTTQENLPTIEQMVGTLEQRLEQDPENVEGWSMLARTYMVMGQYEKAANALYKVQGLVGENPDVLVDIADALAMQQGGRLDGKPIELLRQALAGNPSQLKALWLIGMYEFQQGNAAVALMHWRRLEPMLVNDPDSQQELRKLIVRAEEQSGEVSVPVKAAEPTVATNGSLKVTVSMSAEMIGRFSPDDTLFIFARARSGPPMPLAVYRGKASDLPVEVTLDDSMAMTPMMKLSGFQDVSVMARISKTGQAKPAPGDLYGEAPGSIAPGQSAPVTILIDQVQG